MIINNKFLTLIVFLIFVTSEALAVTRNFDGSKTDVNGKLIKGPSYLDFQKALNDYWNSLYPIEGEEVPLDSKEKQPEDSNVQTTENLDEDSLEPWPTAKLDQNGNPIKVPGYFGHNIFKEGAPLLEIPTTLSKTNPEEDIALHNGLAPEDFVKVLIAFSNPEWQNEKNISEEVVNMSAEYTNNLADTEFETYEIAKITDMISDAGDKAFKDGSRKNEVIKDKMEEFFNLESDDENDETSQQSDEQQTADLNKKITSDDVLKDIQAEKKEISDLDFNKAEEDVLLQAQLKTIIERATDDSIEDLGLTMSNLNNIIKDQDSKNGNVDEGVTTTWAYTMQVKRDLTVNQIALNIQQFKGIMEKSMAKTEGFEGEAVPNETMLKAIASWDESPGSIIDRFVEFSKFLDAEAVADLAEDFNASVRNSIAMLGDGDFDLGLKKMELNNMGASLYNIQQDIDLGVAGALEEKEALIEQMSALGQELGLGGSSGPTSFGTSWFDSCQCEREVTQEDVNNADPVTGQYQ